MNSYDDLSSYIMSDRAYYCFYFLLKVCDALKLVEHGMYLEVMRQLHERTY